MRNYFVLYLKGYILSRIKLIYTLSGIPMSTVLSEFVKHRRRVNNMTQEDLAYKAGVGLRFIRDMEQGKASLRLDKINQVLGLFGHEAGPVRRQTTTDEQAG